MRRGKSSSQTLAMALTVSCSKTQRPFKWFKLTACAQMSLNRPLKTKSTNPTTKIMQGRG